MPVFRPNFLSPLSTKGDLHGFSTADAKIPVGTDGLFLKADSTQALGLKWAAAGSLNVVTKTANYTVVTTDSILLGNTNVLTFTLPAATNTGTLLRFIKIGSDTNMVTVARSGSDTIAGVNSFALLNQYEEITLVADGGTTWYPVNIRKSPVVGTFSAGAIATYVTDALAKFLVVEMVGGGAGGVGGGTAAGTVPTAGGNTTFGTSFLVANGGSAGVWANNFGTGGTASIAAGASGVVTTGGQSGAGGVGGSSGNYGTGGCGGNSNFGGSGGGGQGGLPGGDAPPNTGAGGGGGGSGLFVGSLQVGGCGGGAGGYVRAIIPNPAASYPFVVGSGGAAGAAGTSGFAGGNGGGGVIIVTAYFE